MGTGLKNRDVYVGDHLQVAPDQSVQVVLALDGVYIGKKEWGGYLHVREKSEEAREIGVGKGCIISCIFASWRVLNIEEALLSTVSVYFLLMLVS